MIQQNEELDVLRRRRPKNHVCKNCEFIIVKINLPADSAFDDNYNLVPKDPKDIMRETAEAMRVNHESKFYCIFTPEWKPIEQEEIHFCHQFVLRENWQLGYQDIERTMERVDQVYATRIDCKLMPERVRRRKAGQ